MRRFRTTTAFFALSALLFAGWTGATHWHFAPQHAKAAGDQAGQSHCTSGNCSHAPPAAQLLEPSGVGCEDQSPMPASGSAESTCELCDFLAGNIFCLAVNFDFAGVVGLVGSLPEPLWMIPRGESRTTSCRGPPLSA